MGESLINIQLMILLIQQPQFHCLYANLLACFLILMKNNILVLYCIKEFKIQFQALPIIILYPLAAKCLISQLKFLLNHVFTFKSMKYELNLTLNHLKFQLIYSSLLTYVHSSIFSTLNYFFQFYYIFLCNFFIIHLSKSCGPKHMSFYSFFSFVLK